MRATRISVRWWGGGALSTTTVRLSVGSHTPKRPPPPLRSKLPPPPPIKGISTPTGAGRRGPPPRRSPHEVLTVYVEYIPTYWTSLSCVAAILPEEEREQMTGRGKFLNFLRKYPFLFDIRQPDSMRCDVRLREDVSHPHRGVADEKFMMTDIGEHTEYVARPEYITSTEQLEGEDQSVMLVPPSAPPAIKVRMEERVPVLGRLQALVPKDFTDIDSLEEKIPEDVLFHPYFDCQGGLRSIGQKFPDYFQVVGDKIRLRPPNIAPLALGDLTLDQSPLPEVAELVRKEVCSSDIPHWVSVTYLYEKLTPEQKREIKRGFRSFSGFLRTHGRELALSVDFLKVSMWAKCTAPALPSTTAASFDPEKGTLIPEHTPIEALNELFDRFPRQKSLSMTETLGLLSEELRRCLPRNILGWLANQKKYFCVENPHETDLDKVMVRRASDKPPLDLVFSLYSVLDQQGTRTLSLTEALDGLREAERAAVDRFGIASIVSLAPEWLAIEENTGNSLLKCLRTFEELEEKIQERQEEGDSLAEWTAQEQKFLEKKEKKWLGKAAAEVNHPTPSNR